VIIIVSLLQTCSGVTYAAGFMPVRNFSRDVYEGGPQNWAITQDSLGRVYVGNRDGMLAFDGERWRKYGLPNRTTVRSVFFDSTAGCIYVGGTGEFGYFSPDSLTGGMRYTSLLPTLGDDRPHFTEVWNIIRTDGKVWFQSDYHLFCFDGYRTEVVGSDKRISCSAMIRQTVYIADGDGCISVCRGMNLVPLPGTDALAGLKIVALLSLPDSDDFIIATSVDGLYIYDGEAATPWPSDINSFIRDNQLFCAASNGLGDIVFGTVTRGVAVKNIITDETSYLNKESGMQNNTVLGAAFDRAGNIWLGLDNGLDYAVYNSPLSNLVTSSNDVGAVYSTYRDGKEMYIGSNQGLYSTGYPFQNTTRPFDFRRELQGQIWSIAGCGGSIFVAGDAGVYVRTHGTFSKIKGLTGAYYAHPLKMQPNAVLASTYDHFHYLEYDGSRWIDRGKVAGDKGIGGFFVEDNQGFLWINHWLDGVYRIRFNAADRRFDEFELLSPSDGLPSERINSVSVRNGRVVFATDSGFYSYNYSSNKIFPDGELNGLFPAASPQTLHSFGDSCLVMLGKSGIGISIAGSGSDGRNSFVPVKSLTRQLVNGYEHVNCLGPREILIANQDGLWNIDSEFIRKPDLEPEPFVNAVYADGDSLIYRAPLAGGTVPQLAIPYGFRSLRFELACPDFRSDGAVRYSSYLENYDSGWTPETAGPAREYTRLYEGRYILHVRSHNLQSAACSEFVFPFRIAPPWYRSGWARLVYVIISLLVGYVLCRILVHWRRTAVSRVERRKAAELEDLRRRAEQEALRKDYEIATLKSAQLEDGIKHRSRELNSATMNLIRKNEILHDIATKIAGIQASTDIDKGAIALQKKLAGIQTSIRDNINHDDDWKAVTKNLDIVYENFTKTLLGHYPDLTAGDIRLCCYIKMGLSSKEIATLISISVKSVEMARYRLRKKMKLSVETSLSDYIARL